MALLVDGHISSLGDLNALDAGVTDVARNEGVDLSGKLEVAEQQLCLEIAAFLLRHRENVLMKSNGEPDLSCVVVTRGLKQWHALKALALLYGDAHNSNLNDRYLAKLRHYESEAKRAASTYFETGVGVTTDPVLRARQPEVVVVEGGPPASTFEIGVAWRNAKGTRGAVSPPMAYSTGDGEGFKVRGLDPAPGANSYDVFLGISGEQMTRQNLLPIPLQEWWTLPPSGLVEGERAPEEQVPDYFIRHGRILRRG